MPKRQRQRAHKKKSRKRKKTAAWKRYQDVVPTIIRENLEKFGLESVEPGETVVQGKTRKWAIDCVAYVTGGRKTVLFEVKRIGRNITPEQAIGFGARVQDVGSDKGYFVTPLNRTLSKGAKDVAAHWPIDHIELDDAATVEQYIMRYLDKIFVRMSDTMHESSSEKDHVKVVLGDEDGNPIREVSSQKQRTVGMKKRRT